MKNVLMNFSMSLDGYVAGADVNVDQPMGVDGEQLHDWIFREPKSDTDVQVAKELTASVGAVVIGRRTYDVGIGPWADTPYPAPCFVLTHAPREPHVQSSGTFTFVDGGIADAVRRAVEAAQGRDVVLMGAEIAQQALGAGLVDEINLQLVPVLLGEGRRLFENIVPGPAFELVRTLPSPRAVHLRYRVIR